MDLVPASRYSVEELTEAYNKTRVDYLIPMPMTPQRLTEYIQTYDINMDASVVAEESGEILGINMLGVREGRAWITRLGVLPTSRRHGVGRVLMEYVIDQAAQLGASMAYLEVIVGNTPAYSLFLRMGFREVRKLLVLRRPPGPPPSEPLPPPAEVTLHPTEDTLAFANTCPWRPAWTNEVESLRNSGKIEAMRLMEYSTETTGWASFQRSALQLRRVIVSPADGSTATPAYNLLYHLHSRFSQLDTQVENVPTHIPFLDAFWAHGYIQSFARIEMELPLYQSGQASD